MPYNNPEAVMLSDINGGKKANAVSALVLFLFLCVFFLFFSFPPDVFSFLV
jgi:hypothetical protein